MTTPAKDPEKMGSENAILGPTPKSADTEAEPSAVLAALIGLERWVTEDSDGRTQAQRMAGRKALIAARAAIVEATKEAALVTEAQKAERRVEARAREIYNSWQFVRGWVPWVEGGNSLKQADARHEARAAISKATGGAS